MIRAVLAALFGLALLVPGVGRAQSITPQDAARHVGQMATVCGQVASARYAQRSRGQPTFLNLGRAYPEQVFTVLIWGDQRSRFGEPEVAFADKRVCVTGRIELYRGKPEIVLDNPAQLRPDTGARGRIAPPSLTPALAE